FMGNFRGDYISHFTRPVPESHKTESRETETPIQPKPETPETESPKSRIQPKPESRETESRIQPKPESRETETPETETPIRQIPKTPEVETQISPKPETPSIPEKPETQESKTIDRSLTVIQPLIDRSQLQLSPLLEEYLTPKTPQKTSPQPLPQPPESWQNLEELVGVVTPTAQSSVSRGWENLDDLMGGEPLAEPPTQTSQPSTTGDAIAIPETDAPVTQLVSPKSIEPEIKGEKNTISEAEFNRLARQIYISIRQQLEWERERQNFTISGVSPWLDSIDRLPATPPTGKSTKNLNAKLDPPISIALSNRKLDSLAREVYHLLYLRLEALQNRLGRSQKL
ncbi:hypothetical protein, partial [Baaleninema sp.]|uniref:hypothetical protein n=1 Tax=Baaleninema sp. TaxID=3101197 RepID=UPI003CFED4F9